MTALQKTIELKKIIGEKITPLITSDYVLLGLPYHSNIGDSLIWEGAETFLKTTPYKCLYTASVHSYNPDYQIPQNVIILINGGGSFGDLWRHNTRFWLYLVQKHPNNKIIILSQSIFYKDKKMLNEDAEVFAKHKNLTICLRDKNSLGIANQYFPSSNNLLVPDMAFYMDMAKWKKFIKPATNRILFLNRKDPEKKPNLDYGIVHANAEAHDWPTMENISFYLRLFYRVQRFLGRIDETFATHFNKSFSDIIYKNIIRKSMVKKGLGFMSSYSQIYTTRLHGAILSLLLQKPFVWFDNSYGKSSSFYDTWLSDVESITFIRE